ncbi:hypothetical protein CVT26_006953 [Gymnopilus dilepis]|uniref:Uncharacterized protein n=1 Tax=Gymnopilus dilepis TaxID=231916 RepID=A0A409X0W3_9AGAR|nr:hypothetical protein CVT26_006953 [Gymnopilus dilepis]
MAHFDLPPVVLVGGRHTGLSWTGKSSLIAGICGVHVGSKTMCPVEWTIMSSTIWKGRVAVAYLTSSICAKNFTSVTRPVFLNPERMCSSPEDLLLLIRKGEILALSGSQNFESVMAMDADMVHEAYIKMIPTTQQPSRGIVYVRLCIPNFETTVKIVDLPGKYLRCTMIDHYSDLSRQLTHETLTMPKASFGTTYVAERPLSPFLSAQMVSKAIVLPPLTRLLNTCVPSDLTTNAKGLPFLKSITKDVGLDWAYGAQYIDKLLGCLLTSSQVTLVLSYAADTVVEADWLDILKESGQEEGPQTCFLFLIPQQRPPFVTNDLSKLRRREELLLRLRAPWAQGSTGLYRDCFGVLSILESWQAISDTMVQQEVRRPCLELWKYFVILFKFVTSLAIALVQ